MPKQHHLVGALDWLCNELDDWAQDVQCQRYNGDVGFVASDLLKLCKNGAPFTSHKELAHRLDCAVEAIREGLWWYEKTRAWAGIVEDLRPSSYLRKQLEGGSEDVHWRISPVQDMARLADSTELETAATELAYRGHVSISDGLRKRFAVLMDEAKSLEQFIEQEEREYKVKSIELVTGFVGVDPKRLPKHRSFSLADIMQGKYGGDEERARALLDAAKKSFGAAITSIFGYEPDLSNPKDVAGLCNRLAQDFESALLHRKYECARQAELLREHIKTLFGLETNSPPLGEPPRQREQREERTLTEHRGISRPNDEPYQQAPSHSDDFTTVDWHGTRHIFAKGNQAETVRVLWEAFDAGGHGLSELTIKEKIGSENDHFRLAHVFRNRQNGKMVKHPAFETMIKPLGKGVFALVSPESPNNPTNPIS